jgi:tetratricopeptide (TPR) repeat protein
VESETALPAPLSPEEAAALRAAGSWRELASRGAALSDAALAAEPEVAYAVAAAFRHVGGVARALELAETAEAEARVRGDRRLAAEAVNLAGNCLFELGRPAEAEARFEELLAYAADAGEEEYAARAANNLGVLANVRGARDRALAWYGRALASYQRLGNVRGLAETHHNLGISYRHLGFVREADAHYQRAIALAEEALADRVAGLAETGRALLAVRAGDGPFGEALAGHAQQRFASVGDAVGEAEAVRVQAAAARADGRDDDAAERLEAALAVARARGNTLLLADVQRDRGLLFRDRGQAADARQALLESAGQYDALGAAAEAGAVRMLADDIAVSEEPSPPDAPAE